MLIGEKINITALNEEDKYIILKWVNNNKLKKYTGTVFPVSDIEHENWFRNIRTNNDHKIYGIRSKEDIKLYGVIGLKNFNYITRNAELYVYIGESSFRGKGYASDAINTLVDFAFKRLNLHKIRLRVFDYNLDAISLYKYLGFKIEGTLIDEHFYDGEYHNVIIMGLINELGD